MIFCQAHCRLTDCQNLFKRVTGLEHKHTSEPFFKIVTSGFSGKYTVFPTFK